MERDKRDIGTFVEEFASYVNRFIAGREGSHILKCNTDGGVTNRGHSIPIEVVMPEGMPDRAQDMCLCMYAEEMLEEFPKGTTAAIAEAMCARLEGEYGNMMSLLAGQMPALDRTMDDCCQDSLIISAFLEGVRPVNQELVVAKRMPELGLVLEMKANTGRGPDERHSYFAPVTKGRDATKEEWEAAKRNSLAYADIHAGVIASPANHTPCCGRIEDTNGFYDYFYLLSPREVWGGFVEKAMADRLYIIPDGAYAAEFIVDGPLVNGDPEACAVRGIYMGQNGKPKQPGIFVLDCRTMEVKLAMRGGTQT